MRHAACLAAALVLLSSAAYAAGPSPVGAWRTFDDQDGKESGSVIIFDKDGQLFGNITSITDQAQAGALCTLCTDDRKDKPVKGMQVIRGMRADGDEWDGGQIIDPKTGKVYKCAMRMTDGGQKLVVRGYIGISLIGRSQTWLRK